MKYNAFFTHEVFIVSKGNSYEATMEIIKKASWLTFHSVPFPLSPLLPFREAFECAETLDLQNDVKIHAHPKAITTGKQGETNIYF